MATALDKKIAAKIKAAPTDLFKKAMTEFNDFLKGLDPARLPINKGKNKHEAGINFIAGINDCIERDEADKLPVFVVEFYNGNLLVDEEEPKEEKPKKEKKAPKKVARDTFGFIEDSVHSKIAVLLSEKPMKMGDIKKEFGNTYYSLMSKSKDIFGKDAINQFYVKGSTAEKAITTTVPEKKKPAAKKKVEAKPEEEKAPAKKKVVAKKKKPVAKKK